MTVAFAEKVPYRGPTMREGRSHGRARWIGALALVTLTVRFMLPLYQTLFTILIAYALMFLPRALVALRASIAQAPVELEQIAATLGRTPLRAVHAMMRLWGDVRARLDLVYCPVLLFRSATDRVVPGASAEIVIKQVSSDEVTEVVLRDSAHVAPLDHDAETIITGTLDFIARHGAP